LIDERYLEVKSSLEEALREVESVAITTDAATTISQFSLQAVTAHFINAKWELKSALLENVEMPERHTAENLVALLTDAFKRWGIQDKVYTTTDATLNILKCCKNLEATDAIEESIRCFCHTCHLAVKTAIDDTHSIQATLSAARGIVRFSKFSNTVAEAFRRLQRDEEVAEEDLAGEAEPVDHTHPQYHQRPLKLLQDVVTRWSSTHIMCVRLVKLKQFVCKLTVELKPELSLSALQWKQLQELCQVLQPCADAIKLLEGEFYPTLSWLFPQLSCFVRSWKVKQPRSRECQTTLLLLRRSMKCGKQS